MTNKRRPSPPDGDDAVGYGRPPRHTQFQKGRSGNPKGRRRGSKNFSTLLKEELAQSVTLIENGKRKTMSKIEALAKQLVHRAMGNDPKALAFVLGQLPNSEGSAAAANVFDIDQPENKRVMESIIRRIRSSKDAADEPETPPDNSEEST